jgi:hypothetical protein
LRRTAPPRRLTEGNREFETCRLHFEETLDLPEDDGPWGDELKPSRKPQFKRLREDLRDSNFFNLL